MLLRYLKIVTLNKGIKTRQPNGSVLTTYETIKQYRVQIQELDDEISASIYGANLVNMLRIKSPLNRLEEFLRTKLCNETDNISQYYIFIDNAKYKIKSVNNKGIEIELI